MEAINELDTVVLKQDLPQHGLTQGDVGTVVHRYGDSEAVEVEFVTGQGKTVAVLTLEMDTVRLMQQREILHVREMAA